MSDGDPQHRVTSILEDPSFDDPACDQTRDEAIWSVVDTIGWDVVRDRMLGLLEDDRAQQHWATAVNVIWYGVNRPMPKARVIALIYHRLLADGPHEPLDENLVWSIARNLKGVDYLSDYDPTEEPDVKRELARLRAPRV